MAKISSLFDEVMQKTIDSLDYKIDYFSFMKQSILLSKLSHENNYFQIHKKNMFSISEPDWRRFRDFQPYNSSFQFPRQGKAIRQRTETSF